MTNRKINSALIHYNKFNIGGAQRSILRMINYLVEEGVNVTLVLDYPNGELEKDLPNNTIIKYLNATDRKSRKDLLGINLIKFHIIRYLNMRKYRSNDYDLAVVGFQNMNPKFVAKHVNANVKLHWIRSDIAMRDNRDRIIKYITKYSKYSFYYPCVSNSVLTSFNAIFPNLLERSFLIYNFINQQEIINDVSFNPYQDSTNSLKIVTVCRLEDKSKGLYRMINVCEELILLGYNVKWFLVGSGPDMINLKHEVEKRGLDEHFVLVGKQTNPYPYIKYSDIVAILSYYEGLSGVINEAKILGKPVICTDFAGSKEQIQHKISGYIVNNDEESIVKGFKDLFDNDLITVLSNNLLPDAIINNDSKYRLLIQLLTKS